MNLKIVASMPIHLTSLQQLEDVRQVEKSRNDLFLKEFENLLKKDTKDYKVTNFAFDCSADPKYNFPFEKHHLDWCDFINISAELSFEDSYLDEIYNDNENIEYVEFCELSAAAHFSSRIEEILFVTEIALPGAIRVAEGKIKPKADSYGYLLTIRGKFACDYLLAPNEYDDQVWPPLVELPITKCLDWAYEIGFGNENFAVSKISRALAALSNAFTRDSEELFRAMQGLEAFYCDSKGDLRRQLSEKSSIFIGKWPENKNIVGKLYDLRSKFVHGSANIEYFNEGVGYSDIEEKMYYEHCYASNFAVRLLVATIQKCIAEGITSITWELSYKVNLDG